MRKSVIILGILLMAAIIAIYFYSSRPLSPSDDKVKTSEHSESIVKEVVLNPNQYQASNITLGFLEMKNLSEVINANGYTKLPPQNQADVSVYMAGVVKSIHVIEGQFVNTGQTLATIQSPEFVKLQENYLISKNMLEYLAVEFERQKTLTEENVNAKKQFQKVKLDYESEKVRHHALEKQISLLNINESSFIYLAAPISGFITKINIKIGNNAEPGKPLFTIVDNSKMHIDLLVYENDLHRVRVGQNVRFVFPNQDNTEISGKIFSIGKAFENETKSVAVHAEIANDRQMLIPGMYVKALIDIGINAVTALPVEAVVKADGKEFIFVLEEEHSPDDESKEHIHGVEGHKHKEDNEKKFHFQRIEVKTGTVQLGYVQIIPLQDLNPKAKIALSGTYYIQSHLLKSEGGGGHEH